MAVLRQRQTLRGAVVRVLERQLDLVLDVAARTLANAASRAGSCTGARTTASHAAAAEERGEEIGEGVRVAEQLLHFFLRHRAEAAASAGAANIEAAPERSAAWLRAGLFVHAPIRAQLVVLLPLFGIAQHFVSFVDFLEACFGGLVARIDVRMELAGQLAKGLLDLLLRGRLRDAERFVIVLEFHRS